MRLALTAAVLAVLLAPGAVRAQSEADRLGRAKALFFDREYAEARGAWQTIAARGGLEAQDALYWVARCSESLGENERALGEYGEYLSRRPANRVFAEEARTSRVALGVKLARAGRPERAAVAREALSDPSRTVRYFAALQLASLGPDVGRPAVPVLKEILARERDADLVERAKLALLRVDPDALAGAGAPARHAAQKARFIRVRLFDKGATRPTVSIDLPLALAEMVFKSLPDDARSELRKQGYEPGNFSERLRSTGPTDILSIQGDDGERIQVWIE